MVLANISDAVTRRTENLAQSVSSALFEPVIRLGVTGLSRSGKTVFITSLVTNLLKRGLMPQLAAQQSGMISSVFLQPQPDDMVPRFDYETHLDALLGKTPKWPESTRAISELRLSFRVHPKGLLAGFQGPKTIHLDIVDYPGEWLLDLALIDKTYDEWAKDALQTAVTRPMAQGFLDLLDAEDLDAKFDDVTAGRLASEFATYLQTARQAGFSDCTPGRFLMPGDLAGSPVLTFAPLPDGVKSRGSLRREMDRRFEAYKSRVVRPFFRDHFSKIDRQIVLVDVLGALAKGPGALADLETVLAEVLSAFRPGQNNFLSSLFLGRRIDRILFAATKADHVHHDQHGGLTALLDGLINQARNKADFNGAKTAALAISSLRSTTEMELTSQGAQVGGVKGRLMSTGRAAGFYAGELPKNPTQLLAEARQGGQDWEDVSFHVEHFLPPKLALEQDQGLPHMRMDKALQFLIGDKLWR